MVTRPKKEPRAQDLMAPLRVCVGATERIAQVARRMQAHDAAAAPVVKSGRPVGLITRSLVENASRYGLHDVKAVRLVFGGARFVPASADTRTLRRRTRGIAPGVLVGRPRGPVRGFVTRHRLEEAIGSGTGGAAVRARSRGSSLAPRMDRHIGPESMRVVRAAAKLATARGVELHLVGGVVRDILLGVDVTDLDLVVAREGVTFARELARSLGGSVTGHHAFGTAVVRLPTGARVDVATARRERYESPGCLPTVEPGSMVDDFLRRDVTINSMAIRLDGGRFGCLVDELDGRRDLGSGVLRVHHPLSIIEDPTRAYRIARFAARFGFAPTEETWTSLRLCEAVGAFDRVTGERLYNELGMLVREPDPAAALGACSHMGLLRHLGPALRWSAGARRAITRLFRGLRKGLFGSLQGLPEARLLVLMVLSINSREAQRVELARRLRIRGLLAERLRSARPRIASLQRTLRHPMKPSRLVRVCEGVGSEVLALGWATGSARARRRIERYLGTLRTIRSAVTGEDLRAMGLAAGPAFREILASLREARLDGRVADEASERRLAARLVSRRQRRSH